MQATPQTGAEIQTVLDQFCASYGEKDINGLLHLFNTDPNVLVIGTGEDEKRTGQEEIRNQFERDFCRSEKLSVEFENVAISEKSDVCWVAGDTNVYLTAEGRALHVYLRFTAVLTRRAGKWLFVQTHFSVPFSDKAG
jgi:ketosteroid isomerase-like protein